MQNKVLVIEDNHSFSSLLVVLFDEKLGISCDVAETRAEAQSLLLKNAENYFAAIVDLNLPDAPRGQAAELVVDAGVPAVVFTSSEDLKLKDALWATGIADYALKSSSHSIEYVVWVIERLRKNKDVKLLLVDNQADSRKHMKALLKTQRYEVICADGGDEAVSMLKSHPDISVVIVDGEIDQENGFQLVSNLRSDHSRDSLEIIGLSASASRGLSAQFIKCGANDFLLKPFLPEEFLCRVNHATERIERYKTLQELNRTKNQLLGTAAHDIRGPVAAIKTASDYILRRQPKPERMQSLMEMIETSSTGLLNLLSDLLDVSAIEGGELRLNLAHVNMSELVMERLQLYLAKAESKDIEINPYFEEGVRACVDPVKIRQVIDNLLTNAIKYSPIGGKVHLYLENTGQELKLRIEDSGTGIVESEQASLFIPFKVLSSKATAGEKSTGLGLAIAKNVVEAHQGKIIYANAELGGAAFCLSIPNQV